MWEMIVRFVDIGRIANHHCLCFLFIVEISFISQKLHIIELDNNAYL
jgi:hypothetical protein